ncbi:MAG: SpoIVB peptidase S55 domain-containing protein [Candidatus Bipolaricaulota bacterium]
MHRRTLIICGIILLISTAAVLAYERDDFLFLSEIEIGMQGIGKTVVAGDVISEFEVEVLGVVNEPKTRADFIVVRVSGEAIGRSGGISQGMSGSPIYVDGKLVGALSRAATWSKDLAPIGLVTPIEQMLDIIDSVHDRRLSSASLTDATLTEMQLVELEYPPGAIVLTESPDTIFCYPIVSPLLVSGLSGRALEVLMNGLEIEEHFIRLPAQFRTPLIVPKAQGLSSFGLRLNPMSGKKTKGRSAAVVPEPGGAIAVALAQGDITIGALGTLTFREGNAIVGFGHPFLLNGEASFPLTTAHIYDTIKAYDASFKLGAIGETIGVITEDRMSGIGGFAGEPADMVDLSLSVEDLDTGLIRNFQIELVDEPRLMWELLLASGFEAIDSTLDRIGQGTVEVTYRITGDGMPAPLTREDIFLSTRDLALYPPIELASIVSLLQYNAFENPEITSISCVIRVTEELNAMRINHLEIDKQSYAPGEMIHYTVELQTYQREKQVIEGEIQIPVDLVADYVTVRAYGGPREVESGEDQPKLGNLQDLMEKLEGLPSYDTLTIELFAPNPFFLYVEGLQGVDDVETDFPGYVLYGEREVSALLSLPE